MARSSPDLEIAAERVEAPERLDALDQSILRSLRRIIRSVDLYSKELRRDYSLTGPQLLCLRHLVESGPTFTGALAREICLSPATVTGILDRLESRGLIERTRGSADRRQVRVGITSEGRSLAARAPLPLNDRFVARLHRLPPEARATIDRVLSEVVEMMEAGDVDAAPILTTEAALGEPAPDEEPPRR